jgi:phosphoribosylanthranilate isomerase
VSHTRIKICGITRTEDALAAVEQGVDALGFVFYPPSPRYVSPEQAAAIIAELPPFVTTVGLFVDLPAVQIHQIVAQARLDCVQLHGNESAAACAAVQSPWFKAIRVRADTDWDTVGSSLVAARALLLDTYCPGVPGGTGVAFDWSLVPTTLVQPVILAGGLHPGNVAQAVCQVRPYAVDVSGGVESAPGVKDAVKIADFVAQVRCGDKM